MPLSGHCLCNAVTYKVDVDAPLLTGYDHCDDCQRQSGSTYCACTPQRNQHCILPRPRIPIPPQTSHTPPRTNHKTKPPRLTQCTQNSPRLRSAQGQAHRQRPRQEVEGHRLVGQRRVALVLRRVRLPHRPRPGRRPGDHCPQGWLAGLGDQEGAEAGMFCLVLVAVGCWTDRNRTPRSGPSASCLSARSTWPSRSSTCRSKWKGNRNRVGLYIHERFMRRPWDPPWVV